MKKKLIIVVGLVAVLGVVGLVVALLSINSIVKAGVQTVGPQITKVPITVDGVNISVFSGSGEITGLVVGNPEGYKTPSAISVGHVAVAVSPGSVVSDKVVVRSVVVQNPEITFEGSLNGNNLSKILANVQAVAGGGSSSKEPAAKDKGAGKKLQVDEFKLIGAKLHASITLLGGKAVTLPIPDIILTNLGQGPEGITPAELISLVLKQVTESSVKAVANSAGSLGKGVLDGSGDVGKGATDAVKGVGKGIGDLFKKK
jgi:hypothetical protein